MIPGKTYTPEDVLRVALRRKWQIILPFVLIASSIAFYSYILPNRYRSETLILVVPQRVPESYVRSTVTSPIEDRLRSISDQILSRSRLEQIITEFGLYVELRQKLPMEEVVAAMRGDINVGTVRGDSFRVAYMAGDPTVAMKVTGRLASMFIEENLRDREVQADGTNRFLEVQLESARQRLIAHEQRLEEYRKQYATELPTQLQANVSLIVSQRQQLQVVTESINRDRDQRLVVEKAMNDTIAGDTAAIEPSGTAPVDETNPVTKLDAARANLRSLQLRFTADHPDVLAARRQIAELEAEVSRNASAAPVNSDPAIPIVADSSKRLRIRQYQNDLATLDRRIATKERELAKVRETIDEYQRRVDAAPTRESEMTELMRDYKTLNDVYVSLLGKKEDSKLASNLERARAGEQFKILDPARVPEKPFSPNRLQMNFFGVVLGLVLGIGLAALLEFRDSSLRSEDEVVRLFALPVLAVLPVMRTVADQQRLRRRIFAAVASAVVILAGAAATAAWKLGKLG